MLSHLSEGNQGKEEVCLHWDGHYKGSLSIELDLVASRITDGNMSRKRRQCKSGDGSPSLGPLQALL